MTKLVEHLSETEAKRHIKRWAQSHRSSIGVVYASVWWEYGRFWAFIVQLYGWMNGTYGFHVSEDGEVKFIGRMEGYENQD